MRRLLIVILTLFACGCSTTQHPIGQNTVVWISIDGLRWDYVQRAQPTTLSRLAREGAYTNDEVPVFPSLTFPNHVSQVTGTTVDHHGVPMNGFYDSATRQSYSFPDDQSVMRAEPIWTTAKRQGLRTAVIDWPVSHAQTGTFASDYFDASFDSKRSDTDRLAAVTQILQKDRGSAPLRLIMSYASHVDHIGHRNGPDSPEIEQAVREMDGVIAPFVQSVTTWFDVTPHAKEDRLYVLLTTDHGMEPVHTLVNLDRLIGAELASGAKIITSGPNASVYLTDVPAEQRAARTEQILQRLKSNSFVSAWKAADVPREFHYSDSSRLGEVIVLLSPGYNFTSQRVAATQPIAADRTPGVHGYDPAVCPNMRGTAILWCYGHSLGGANLGRVENTQWHATVAKLLAIQPAAESDHRTVALPALTRSTISAAISASPVTKPTSAPPPPPTTTTTSNTKIDSFQGPYRFLSNFWPAEIEFEGITYPTVEHAYQSAKTLDMNERRRIAALPTPAEAKSAGRALKLRADWETAKFDVMERCVREKFTRHADLREKLLATGDAVLEEGNTWNDRIWGVYQGQGENRLGKILMKVRQELRTTPPALAPSR